MPNLAPAPERTHLGSPRDHVDRRVATVPLSSLPMDARAHHLGQIQALSVDVERHSGVAGDRWFPVSGPGKVDVCPRRWATVGLGFKGRPCGPVGFDAERTCAALAVPAEGCSAVMCL